jgi:hypothetical protein
VKVPFSFTSRAACRKAPRAASGEGASYADSFDSGGCEVFDGEGCAFEAHEDVDGFGDGGADLADGFEGGESGSVEDVGARVGEGLQAADGVVEIGAVVEEVFGACGEEELMGVGGFCCGLDSFDG